MKKLMTPQEVEAEFGLSLRLQEDLRRRRQLPFHKMHRSRGGRVLVQRADIEALLERTRVPQKTEEGAR
jgi:hypothetical protein